MTTFYCTNCWAEVAEAATVCPRCGDDILARQARADFVDKLIAALHHPESTTPVRAAWILGRRRERKAVPALIGIIRTSDDVFLVDAALEALGMIGDQQALDALWEATHHPVPRLRRAAERALRRVNIGDSSKCRIP